MFRNPVYPLYLGHFGLSRGPFNVTPDPSFLYLSASHQEALAQIVYGINARKGFIVLTGEVGTGKTTLIHALLEELKNGNTRSALIFNTIINSKDLLRYVCEDFGLSAFQEDPKEIHSYLKVLNQFLLESCRKGGNVALIIDEAQNLSTEVLESIRLLSNFETSENKLLQILMAGQPELAVRLNSPGLRQLKQRIVLRHHLSPLNFDECREYIAKRLEIAGGTPSIFSSKALETIYTYSGGIPRLINILCDNGLLTAYALRKKRVEAVMIREAAEDLSVTFPTGGAAGVEAEVCVRSMRQRRVEPPVRRSVPFSDLTDEVAAEDSCVEQPAVEQPAVEHSTVFSTGGTTDAVAGSTKTTPDVVSTQFFSHMMSSLTEAMGPMASLVIREQVSALGESLEAFPKSRLAELVEAASQDILDEPLKMRFRQLILEEIPTIDSGKEEK